MKVTHELRESQRRAILMGRRDAAGRLAMFVMMMGKHADQAGKAAGIVPLPMTRSDIAGFLDRRSKASAAPPPSWNGAFRNLRPASRANRRSGGSGPSG